jgi:hypothetical protein
MIVRVAVSEALFVVVSGKFELPSTVEDERVAAVS